MALDPSIALSVRTPPATQIADPLEQYAKVMSLKNLAGQQSLQALQTEKATQDLSDEKAYREAAQESGGDLTKLRDLLYSRGAPHQALAVETSRLKSLKDSADLQKIQQEVEGKAMAQHRDQLADVKDPQSAAQWVASAYKDPILGPLALKSGPLEQALARIPQDPKEFQNWVAQNALGATKYIEANKPTVHMQNLGGLSNIVSVPGLGGAPTTISSTPTTMTPSERANLDMRAQELKLHQLTADPFGLLTGGQGMPAGVPSGGMPPNVQPAGAQPSGGPALQIPSSQPPAGGILGNLGIAPDTHGDEFLAKLPSNVAGQVKALAEGRMAFPSGMGLRSPVVQQLLGMVSQYDPNFDAVNYGSRFGTRKAFTSGTESKILNALNTVAGHMDEFEKAASALNNTSFPLVNKAANALGGEVSPDLKGRLNQFNLTKQAVVSEMERAYRGTGGSQADIEAWKQTLNDADSPQAIKASITQGAKLLRSKIEALGDQYNKGMGTAKNGLELLSPKAQTTFQRLLGEAPANTGGATASFAPTQADIDAELRRRGVIK